MRRLRSLCLTSACIFVSTKNQHHALRNCAMYADAEFFPWTMQRSRRRTLRSYVLHPSRGSLPPHPNPDPIPMHMSILHYAIFYICFVQEMAGGRRVDIDYGYDEVIHSICRGVYVSGRKWMNCSHTDITSVSKTLYSPSW